MMDFIRDQNGMAALLLKYTEADMKEEVITF